MELVAFALSLGRWRDPDPWERAGGLAANLLAGPAVTMGGPLFIFH